MESKQKMVFIVLEFQTDLCGFGGIFKNMTFLRGVSINWREKMFQEMFTVRFSTHNLKLSAFLRSYSNTNSLKMPAEAQPILRFAKLTEHAFAPSKGSEKAAGFDLKR